MTSRGWTPPPYPHDRLADLSTVAAAAEGGLVDLSVGNPCDPLPEVVVEALVGALDRGVGYPASIGFPEFRAAATGWMQRRLGVDLPPDAVTACVGTKELVAGLPGLLHLRDPERDVVLYPEVSYPTYAMGAVLAGLRAVPVPLDDAWRPLLEEVADDDAGRALLLWLNEPGNPTGSVVDDAWYRKVIAWARERGVVVASDECYVEFTFGPSATALSGDPEGVLAVHSLSKRSNMAGLRAGFVAGDPALVHFLGEVRKHAGLMVAGPVQVAAAAALCDDDHAEAQRDRYRERRSVFLAGLEGTGLVHEGGPATFYLWVRDIGGGTDGWALTRRLAEVGVLVSPGDLYGAAGADHVRIALVQPLDRIDAAIGVLRRSFGA
jgi:succinyldiaminopimelate transaminase